jgi:hypothetical protein
MTAAGKIIPFGKPKIARDELPPTASNYGPGKSSEHNRLLARLLDDAFCLRLLERIWPADDDKFRAELRLRYATRKQRQEAKLNDGLRLLAHIEELRGKLSALESIRAQLDQGPLPQVVQRVSSREFEVKGWDAVVTILYRVSSPGGAKVDCYYTLAIDAQLSLGDEFPAVLRQIKQHRNVDCLDLSWHVLLVERITAAGATDEQIKAIFRTSSIELVRLAEIEGGGVVG